MPRVEPYSWVAYAPAMEFAETAAAAADDSSFRSHGIGREEFSFGRPMLYVYLALGGVLGTLARHGLGGWVHTWSGGAFPWGTLVVNLLGSFLLGFATRGAGLWSLSPELRAMITVGFCGAFTTFSAFTYETLSLVQEGAWMRASLYSIGSVVVGLASMGLGLFAATLLLRPGG